MRLEFHQLDRRWEHLRVRHPARQRRLLASLAEVGQQTPIVVVAVEGQPDRYLVIDGYKRLAALQQLGRDTVEAVVWPLREVEALLLDRSLRWSEPETALEQGWLLAELEQRYGYGREELARRFDRSTSWVSRRLALVDLLPEAIQQQVREGRDLRPRGHEVPGAGGPCQPGGLRAHGRCLRSASLRYAASRATVCGLARRLAPGPPTSSRPTRVVFQNPATRGTERFRHRGRCTAARSGHGAAIMNRAQRRLAGRGSRRDGSSATPGRTRADRTPPPATEPLGGAHPRGGRTRC